MVGGTFQCDGCSAYFHGRIPEPFHYVCPICTTTNQRSDGTIINIGKAESLLEDLTPIVIGSKCAWAGVTYEVIGRFRLEYEEGYYRNQWVLSDGANQLKWLLESYAAFALVDFFSVAIDASILKSKEVGASFPLQGSQLFYFDTLSEISRVTKSGHTPILGELRKGTLSLELSSNKNGWAIIDVVSRTNANAYMGEVVTLEKLKFDKLRDLDGWSI